MKKQPVFGLILAGGASSRLFPFNKVLADLTGAGRTLIQQSFDRLGLPRSSAYVLTVRDMVAPVRKQLKFSPQHFFVDPVRRGTWPAILWAMAHLRQENPEAVLAIVTGDHVIQGQRAFRDALKQAVEQAVSSPACMMLGIPPSQEASEWCSFGCFRKDDTGRVIAFEEKPTPLRAQQMMAEGGWSWSSGMFFFRISTAEQALKSFQPEMCRVYLAITQALESGKKKDAAFLFEDFPNKIPHPLDPSRYVDNSIDYAILTPLIGLGHSSLSAQAVPDPKFQWIDLGQWDALRKVVKADRQGNVRVGQVRLGKGVERSILVAEKGRSISCTGASRLIIAFAQKTALVMAEDKLSFIKEYVQEALKHPDRLIMEHDASECVVKAAGGRLIVAGVSGLSIRLQNRQLLVAPR